MTPLPTLDTSFPEIRWCTQRSSSRSTAIEIMVEAAIKVDLKAALEAADKANTPTQLFGYLSTLAGLGAEIVPSAVAVPELQKLIDAKLPDSHRPRSAPGSPAR